MSEHDYLHPTEYAKRTAAYHAAYTRADPCDECGKVQRPHHATVWGRNLCHACYEAAGHPCTQVYPGDAGLPIAPFGGE